MYLERTFMKILWSLFGNLWNKFWMDVSSWNTVVVFLYVEVLLAPACMNSGLRYILLNYPTSQYMFSFCIYIYIYIYIFIWWNPPLLTSYFAISFVVRSEHVLGRILHVHKISKKKMHNKAQPFQLQLSHHLCLNLHHRINFRFPPCIIIISHFY